MIVEDNPLVRELLSQMLEDHFEILLAENGEVGVRMAREQIPELILMDLTMPVMSGWDAIAALRNEWATCRIPIIALTAISEQREINRALELGADAYVEKPIDEDELFGHLGRLLAGELGGRASGVRRRDAVRSTIEDPDEAAKP